MTAPGVRNVDGPPGGGARGGPDGRSRPTPVYSPSARSSRPAGSGRIDKPDHSWLIQHWRSSRQAPKKGPRTVANPRRGALDGGGRVWLGYYWMPCNLATTTSCSLRRTRSRLHALRHAVTPTAAASSSSPSPGPATHELAPLEPRHRGEDPRRPRHVLHHVAVRDRRRAGAPGSPGTTWPHTGDAIRLRERGDLAPGRDAADAREVEDHHVDGTRVEERAERVEMIEVLAGRDRDLELTPRAPRARRGRDGGRDPRATRCPRPAARGRRAAPARATSSRSMSTMIRTSGPTASRTARTRRASSSAVASLPRRSFTAPKPASTWRFAEAASSSGDRLYQSPSLA